MKIAISVFILLALFVFISCRDFNKVKKDSIQIISEQEVGQYQKQIETDSVLLRLVKSGNEFPTPFVTYIPVDFANHHSQSEDGNIILFKYKNKATISFTVLPKDEFSTQKQGVAYIKELLGLIAEDVQLQKDGFYRGKSLGRYQNAKIGQRNGYVYYWLLDSPFELKDDLLKWQTLILNEFRWVE